MKSIRELAVKIITELPENAAMSNVMKALADRVYVETYDSEPMATPPPKEKDLAGVLGDSSPSVRYEHFPALRGSQLHPFCSG